MTSADGLNELYQAFIRRGYDDATASLFTARIGDTPEVNAAGLWVIRDESGAILATIEPIPGP